MNVTKVGLDAIESATRRETIEKVVAILEQTRDEYMAKADAQSNELLALAKRAQADAIDAAILNIHLAF